MICSGKVKDVLFSDIIKVCLSSGKTRGLFV